MSFKCLGKFIQNGQCTSKMQVCLSEQTLKTVKENAESLETLFLLITEISGVITHLC